VPGDVIRAEGAIIRQSSASKHFSKNLYCGFGRAVENPAVGSSGSGLATFIGRRPSKLVSPWHEPLPLSKSAYVGGWWFVEKWFSGREFVAEQRSGFLRTAIADRAIAVQVAARKLDASNAALPTAAINRVGRAGSIIATGNGRTDGATRRLA
jgi:hypothetical protein